MESSETWRTKALKSFAISKSGMQGGEAKRNLPWSILDDSHVSHFWSTSWSPIYACYMSFRSSGSQQSNASNSAQFEVEMKELQPLEADHSKLKEEFCTALRNHPFVARWFRSLFVQCCGFPPEVSRHDGSRIPQAERPLRSVAKSAVCCEVISQPFVCICEISQTSVAPAKWSLVLPDICAPNLLDIFFRYFRINFHSSPCNPPTIRFLS